MRRRDMARTALAVSLLACLASVAAVTPAAAAELPAHERLSTIDVNTGVLYDVDAAGAASGGWDTGLEQAIGLALDDSGSGFITTQTADDWQSTLWSVDVTTQTVEDVAPLTLAGSPERTGFCAGLELYLGELYAYCSYYEAPGGTNTLSTIDTTTGEFTPIFVFSTGGTEELSPAIDPADGAFFFTGNTNIYHWDLDDFDIADLPSYQVGAFPTYTFGTSFASDGVMWASVPFFAEGATLATWDRATGETEVIGPIESDVDGPIDTFALTVWGAAPAPAPALAATGAEPELLLPAAAGILLLGGLALLATRRRRAA
jgi:LPXTG-motif cell wall-anchored protein